MLTFTLCSLFVGIAPAVAAPTCSDVYSDKVITAESAQITKDLETKARGYIEQYKAKFLVPEKRARRIRFTQMKKVADRLTNFIRKINGNAYPFAYLRDGFVQEIRVWIKTGEADSSQSVESLMKRYKDYPMSRRLLIERTAFVRTEFEFLNSLLKLPDNRFPISVEIPQAIQKGVLTENLTFKSKDDVRREIEVLEKNESLRISTGFSRGAFFRGREREQAQLEQVLTIAYRELKKFPLALKDAKKRAELIVELEKVLADPELRAISSARYIEARRQFTAELLFFTGKRDYAKRGEDANDKIWLNDRTDLGIDSESLGPVSRTARLVVATVPLQAAGAMILSVVPIVHHEVRENLFREAYMQEIAFQEDAKFQQSAYEYLKDKHKITVENGQWVMSPKAKADLEHLRELNREFKEDAQREHETAESFQKLLAGDQKPLMSDEQFKKLMSADEKNFSAQAQAAVVQAAASNPQLDVRASVFRLFSAYTVYRESLAEKETPANALNNASAEFYASGTNTNRP